MNLRTARKRAARARAAETAERNREAHGVPKAARLLGRAEIERSERELDGARRSPDDTSASDR